MHEFKVHFDNYQQFEIHVRQLTGKLTKDLHQNWRYTAPGIELIEFMMKWYPHWWRRLDPHV